MNSNIIHCVGDSHASFFSGYDEIQPIYPLPSRNKYSFFKSYRLGAVLAYNLNKNNTKEQGREKLFHFTKTLSSESEILLCFGEIDCRCHLIKQSEYQKKHLYEIIKDCIINYFEVVDELLKLRFKIIIWNVIPTVNSNNPQYPVYGSSLQRNECTILFNKELELECNKRSLFFLSIFENLISENRETRLDYYFDSIHLGQNAMPFVFNRLIKLKPELLNHN